MAVCTMVQWYIRATGWMAKNGVPVNHDQSVSALRLRNGRPRRARYCTFRSGVIPLAIRKRRRSQLRSPVVCDRIWRMAIMTIMVAGTADPDDRVDQGSGNRDQGSGTHVEICEHRIIRLANKEGSIWAICRALQPRRRRPDESTHPKRPIVAADRSDWIKVIAISGPLR